MQGLYVCVLPFAAKLDALPTWDAQGRPVVASRVVAVVAASGAVPWLGPAPPSTFGSPQTAGPCAPFFVVAFLPVGLEAPEALGEEVVRWPA